MGIFRSLHSFRAMERAQACFAMDSRPVILFDGVCNLCNGGVNFILDADARGRLRMAALQSSTGKALLRRAGRSPNDISSIVLVEQDRCYIKSDAVLRIASYLEEPYPLLSNLGMNFPGIIRDFVYDSVASNRYALFGRTNQCRTRVAQFEDRKAQGTVALFRDEQLPSLSAIRNVAQQVQEFRRCKTQHNHTGSAQ